MVNKVIVGLHGSDLICRLRLVVVLCAPATSKIIARWWVVAKPKRKITVNSNDLGAKGPKSDISTRSGEARQAEYADAMYRLLFSHPNVDAICWWNLVDGDWGGTPGGLVRQDLTPKPSYDVIRKLIHEE